MCMLPVVLVGISAIISTATPPNIVQFIVDDLGYDDIGHRSVMGNGGKSITPHINSLIDNGIALHEFYTFKVCSPSRASTLTGRYPWNAGFYDMSDDGNHCTKDFQLLPSVLKRVANYSTHALGKWDIGYLQKRCTATLSGFDTFLGYYKACTSDYWYHWSAEQCDGKGPYVDMSNSTSGATSVSDLALNGTYNAHVFVKEAVRLIEKHDKARPMYLYLAPQNVHLACGKEPGNVAVQTAKHYGLQAPCSTVDLYTNTESDTVKLQGGMVTELDFILGNITAALQRSGMWENTVLTLASDNGAQLDHGYNAPLRGGKHTFWEGGVRVVSFVSSPLLPAAVRGTNFSGMAHSSDWYATFVEGVAGGKLPSDTGPQAPDGLNLWPALLSGGPSPRTEVVHQVSSKYFDATTGETFDANGKVLSKGNCDGSCGQAIRMGDWKLIVGDAGDDRIMTWPKPSKKATPFGLSGGYREKGTDHCRALDGKTQHGSKHGVRLFNLKNDLSESNDLAGQPEYADRISAMQKRLQEVSKKGPPVAYLYSKADEKAATGRVCELMEKSSFLQPSDTTPVPPSPGPSPGPSPSPGPTVPECEKAGGISAKDGIACCPKSCGQCGGNSCGKLPGGHENCCKGKVEGNGKDCRTDVAPCSVKDQELVV